MPIRFRKRIPLGPFRVNLTERGFSSWSFRLGPFTWNNRTRRTSVDLPGPLSYRSRSRRRKDKPTH